MMVVLKEKIGVTVIKIKICSFAFSHRLNYWWSSDS